MDKEQKKRLVLSILAASIIATAFLESDKLEEMNKNNYIVFKDKFEESTYEVIKETANAYLIYEKFDNYEDAFKYKEEIASKGAKVDNIIFLSFITGGNLLVIYVCCKDELKEKNKVKSQKNKVKSK